MLANLSLEKLPPSDIATYLGMGVFALILFIVFIVAMSGRWGSVAEVGFTSVIVWKVEPPIDGLGKVHVILRNGESAVYEIGPKIAAVLTEKAIGAMDVRKGRVFAWYPEGLSEEEEMRLQLLLREAESA